MFYILTSDIHTTIRNYLCRSDDIIETQTRKFKWLNDIAKKHNAEIIHGGDLTDQSRPYHANELTNLLIQIVENMYGICGNHDLVDKSMSQLNKSLINNLITNKQYTLLNPDTPTIIGDDYLYGFNFGQEFKAPSVISPKGKTIAVYHELILREANNKFTGVIAKDLLVNFPDYNLILTGDNHKTFVVEHENRLLINPGSFIRKTADQVDFEPVVFLYDSIKHEATPIKVPIEKNIISREHLEKEQETADMLRAFIDCVNDTSVDSINFIKNMENYIRKNNVDIDVVDHIWKCIKE